MLKLLLSLAILLTLCGFDGALPSGHETRSLVTTCNLSDPLERIAFCGNVTTSGGTPSTPAACVLGGVNYPLCADAVTCNFFVAASGGNDNNIGSASAPFATLAHLQSRLQAAPNGSKVGCLEAGSYSLPSTMSFTSSDNGEVWQFDPASGSNTAVINGNNTNAFALNGVSSWKWNGISVHNCASYCFYTPSNPRMNSIIFENSEIYGQNSNVTPGGSIVLDNCTNCKYSHNYFHDNASFGTFIAAFNAGDSINGSVVDSNVYMNFCQKLSDCGGMYTNMIGAKQTGGTLTVTNNFVKDGGASTLTNDVVDYYLDDNSSNDIVKGNIGAPPCAGCINTGNRNNTSMVLINDDGNTTQNQANTVENNIFDLGSSGMVLNAIIGGINNTFSSNIYLSNFTGGLSACSGSDCGHAYHLDNATNTISNNVYLNYASGGNVFTNANVGSGDTSPSKPTSGQLGCSTYEYALASNSIAFSAPVNFQPIVGNWGPQGEPTAFTVPSNTNHSCP